MSIHRKIAFILIWVNLKVDGSELMDEWYIESNNMIYSLLKDKMENLAYHYFEGAKHNESEWRQRVPLFMEFLYEG